MKAVPVALAFLLPVAVALDYESSITADGYIGEQMERHALHGRHGQRHKDKHKGHRQKQGQLHIHHHGVAPPNFRPVREDGKEMVINTWACALMCEGHVEDGCCSYKHNSHLQEDAEHHLDINWENGTGICEFRAGTPSNDSSQDTWLAAKCQAGWGTSKCWDWQTGRCVGPEVAEPASLGLSIWELVWEDHFDRYTCVADKSNVLRPNPNQWSYEIGYKRGRELQWYQPQNVKCEDGNLVITAQRENPPPGPDMGNQCMLKNYDPRPPNLPLNNQSCAQCAPVSFQYYNPCDILQNDSSGWPACDCSHTAQYTSGSIITRGKMEFSYGLFEMRAKIDTREGAWSSWWAIGDFDMVPWPRNGEIDILDAFQRMLKSSIVHADETGTPSGAVQHAAARQIDPDWEQYFHTWQLEWDKDYVVIRVDGEETFRIDLSCADPLRTTWPNPFTNDKKFFFILSLAVGGHSGGDANLTDFPVDFKVDYIRYWKKKGSVYR